MDERKYISFEIKNWTVAALVDILADYPEYLITDVMLDKDIRDLYIKVTLELTKKE